MVSTIDKFLILFAIVAGFLAFLIITAPAAEARGRHHHHSHHFHHHSFRDNSRPYAWCGWYMRQKFGIADPRYNLAREWASIGHRASPGKGVVVVWRHHVGVIHKVLGNGEAIVESGNDGHAVRTRVRSIRNAIAFRSV